MTTELWKHFCIVGIGKHSQTKLIPAILANGQQIVGLVSSKPPQLLPSSPVFPNIETALANLPADTVFIIATPPIVHFEQTYKVAEAGRDVIVEKPAFIAKKEAHELSLLCHEKGTVIIEGLMHRHTTLYQSFLKYWNTHRYQIDTLNIKFFIPELPPGTFRQEYTVSSSCLFDMGCYAISLLADLELSLDTLHLETATDCWNESETICIGGLLDGVKVSIQVGVASTYQNIVEISAHNGERVRFWPFFYGRAGKKWITIESHETIAEQAVDDNDAFQNMFMMPRGQLIADQSERFAQIIRVTEVLEMLGHELMAVRTQKNKFR